MKDWETIATDFLRELFRGESSGHDLHHTLRVYRTALTLQAAEGGDRETVALAALLHDADDPKLFQTEDLANAREFLQRNHASQPLADRVCAIIHQVSYRRNRGAAPDTLEGRLVQDADRLDAIGAIGAARCFAFGGAHGRPIHDPERAPNADAVSDDGTSIDHFYEKLLKLKGLMNTPSGKRMAEDRHAFMETFLAEFFAEWDGAR